MPQHSAKDSQVDLERSFIFLNKLVLKLNKGHEHMIIHIGIEVAIGLR